MIHEFDPYFNFRTTKFLTAEGFYSFHNWFDDRAWYPLGRIIGGTIYPGLMMTAAYAYWILNALNITVNIRCAPPRGPRQPHSSPPPSCAATFASSWRRGCRPTPR